MRTRIVRSVTARGAGVSDTLPLPVDGTELVERLLERDVDIDGTADQLTLTVPDGRSVTVARPGADEYLVAAAVAVTFCALGVDVQARLASGPRLSRAELCHGQDE